MKINWKKDIFDGVLNGILSHGKVQYWFEYHCAHPKGGRCFGLYQLSLSDRAVIKLWRTGFAIWQKDAEEISRGVPEHWKTTQFKFFMKKWRPFLKSFPKFETRPPKAWVHEGFNSPFSAIQIRRGSNNKPKDSNG